MRLGDLDALSAFVGDLRSTLHKEQSTFNAMTQSEFETKDNMYLNFQYAIDNAPTVEERPQGEWIVVCEENNIKTCKCSECGRIEDIVDVDKYPYCHCGADMR